MSIHSLIFAHDAGRLLTMPSRRSLFHLTLAALFFIPASQSSAQRAHPRLLADSSDIVRARQWIVRYPWYRSLFDENRTRIDRFLEHRPIYVSPIKQTYRYKMYTCPRHDVELKYEEFRPFDHRCPLDSTESYRGGMYDMAWAGWYNRRLASHLLWMGLLYQVDGNERYAESGREILLAFARNYLKYPTENTILGPARVFFGTLSESFWGVDMAYGYDLLYNYHGFTADDRALLKDSLFLPLARITQLFPESASNRQLWYNNVSAAVGFLYGDEELTRFALNGRYGFEWQLGSALPESGFWAEWSGYHFVALRGMIHLAEMARHNGLDLYRREIAGRSMKKMFDAPFETILPNFEFPRSKDSGGGNILEYAPYFEVGYAVYHDPKYAMVLNLTNLRRGRQIVGEESGARESEAPITLFMLDPDVPRLEADIVPGRSVNLRGNGFAILRQGEKTRRQYLYLDYGIMGGEHGHPDRLQIGYYARGRNWIVDPLNESYFNPNLQLWYRQTIAHNTPVVDQTSQSWANGEGVFFGDNPEFQIASGRSSTIYPGSTITRTLLQAGDYFVDLCDFRSADERLIDWPIHGAGALKLEGVTLTTERRDYFGAPPSIPGYDQLTEISSGTTDTGWQGIFTAKDGEALLVLGAGCKGTQIFQALTPPLGGFYKQMVADRSPLPMIMCRRRSRSTRFAHLIQAFAGTPTVSGFSADPGDSTFRVQRGGAEDELTANISAGRFSLIRREGGKVKLISAYGVEAICENGRTLLESTTRLDRIECAWSSDSVRITLPGPFVRLRIHAPGIRSITVNGSPIGFRMEHDTAILQNTRRVVMEVLNPEDSLLYQGTTETITLRLWNTTSRPITGRVNLALAPGWKEKVRSSVEWWGGVTNLLPLHKNSVERVSFPSRFFEDDRWIDGTSSSPVSIAAGKSGTVKIQVRVPNDLPAASYPLVIGFDSILIEKQMTVAPPLSASIDIPNGPTTTLRIRLENKLAHAADVELFLDADTAWRPGGAVPKRLTIPARGETFCEIPITLTGYSPANQKYPFRLRMRTASFDREIERDLYVGVARFARTPPSLDGTWRGWAFDRPLTIDSSSQVCKLLLGNQPWRGKRDLSARIAVMYDREYLYVGASVADDSVVTGWNFPAMSYPWDTDCMEVVFDTRTTADQGTDPPTPGLFRHLALAEYRTDDFGPEKWQGAGAGGPLLPKPLLVPRAESYFRRTADGYALICRAPLSSLGGSAGKPGGKIGFDAAINDNDGTTYRKNTHLWAGYTRNQSWWDMGTIGTLFFAPDSSE